MRAYSRGIAFRMAVILSGAKDLSCPSERSFAPLRMTVGASNEWISESPGWQVVLQNIWPYLVY